MFVNNWYAAAVASELSEQPLRIRILDCDLVLFRDSAGNARCLSDTCCHRGASLSAGSLRGDVIACPQHGWEYDCSGRCVRIPAGTKKPTEPPKRARVPAYPAVEQHGLVFVFLGDQAESERPALPNLLPEWADEQGWHRSIIVRDKDIHYVRMAENYNDPCHVHYVHEFGRWLPKGVTIETHEVTDTYVKAFHAAWDSKGAVSPERGLLMEFTVVGLISRNTNHQPGYPPVIVVATVTPIDAFNTRIHMLMLQPAAKVTPTEHEQMVRMTREQVMDEDYAVLKATQPRLAASPTEELLVETDLTVAQVRRMIRDFGARQGEIDTAALAALRDTHISVLPCPGHRSDPGAWVHRTVPLLPPGEAARAEQAASQAAR